MGPIEKTLWSIGTIAILLLTFFKISSFVFSRRKKFNLRVSEYRQNLPFWVNIPLN